MTPGILLISLIFLAIGMLVSFRLRSKFREYSQYAIVSGLSGKEVAEKMLRENGILDVDVISVEGFLTDHYDPIQKTVNLSPEVYNGRSISAAAVAAHECGHAVQHARAYGMLMLRSRLVPVVQFGASIVNWILFIGVLTLRTFPQLLLAGIIIFALITFFSLVTLPVEFDASRRALVWLNGSNVVSGEEHKKAKDALWWAAMTYVVAAANSLVTLFYYILLYMGGRSRN